MEKSIDISNNRKLVYYNIPGSTIDYNQISEGIIINNEVIKSYLLCKWDDYSFIGYNSKDKSHVEFEFDEEHLLYFPLLHFLDEDDEIIIDDDNCSLFNKRILKIYKDYDLIKMEFIDKTDSVFDNVHVFIKNICYDGRSKMDYFGLDTKERLNNFFDEAIDVILEDNHQITLEEYTKKNKILVKEK